MLMFSDFSVNVLWFQCDKQCGGGKQYRMVQCVNMTSQKPSIGCDVSTQPEDTRTCNTKPCEGQNAG